MTDKIPEFNTLEAALAIAPKASRKARRRKAAKKTVKKVAGKPYTSRPGRTYKPRKAAKKARRGRPPGSTNKPKAGERLIASVRQTSNRIKAGIESPAPSEVTTVLSVYGRINAMLTLLTPAERKIVISELAKDV